MGRLPRFRRAGLRHNIGWGSADEQHSSENTRKRNSAAWTMKAHLGNYLFIFLEVNRAVSNYLLRAPEKGFL